MKKALEVPVRNAFDELHNFLSEIADRVNAGETLPALRELSRPDLYAHDVLKPHFQVFRESDEALYVPRATEALRMLSQVKQRFDADGVARPLVARFRMDVRKRERPLRDLYKPDARDKPADAKELRGSQLAVARMSPSGFQSFSQYQVEGWGKVSQSLAHPGGLVITAPTGAGKTEVFMLPLFHHLFTTRGTGQYFLLYPRVELLKDQLSRALLYSWCASQQPRPVTIPVGLQFSGIKKRDLATIEAGTIFDESGVFQPVSECPVCTRGRLKINAADIRADVNHNGRSISRVRTLQCESCPANFQVTISREGHVEHRTRVLLMTAESLERYYLMPRTRTYLANLAGVIADEAHLYEGLYGVHVHQLLRRVEALAGGRQLTKIAVSATIGEPKNFAEKLFYGKQGQQVQTHLYKGESHPHETDGLEVFITLQVPEEATSSAPLLIQSVMALGHGVLLGDDSGGPENQLQVTFIDSLDSSERIKDQVSDAESEGLWKFRTLVPDIKFDGEACPETTPACCQIYAAGECWRGLVAGANCTADSEELRDWNLKTQLISSQSGGKLELADAAVATPTLEVGVDDQRIRAIIQYGAPRSVASYTQRRGRAGRAGKDISYTVMVLGDGPSDHYALTNRHSLQDGRSEIPLNTENPVIRKIHDRLEQERERYGQHENQWYDPEGTVYWMHSLFEKCPRLRAEHAEYISHLATAIAGFKAKQGDKAVDALRVNTVQWVQSNLQKVKPILDMRRSLQTLAENFPAQLQVEADEARRMGELALGDSAHSSEFIDKIKALNRRISDLAIESDADDLAPLGLRLIQFAQAFRRRQNGVMDYAEAQRNYSFFKRLEEWLNKSSTFLWLPPDDMKAILQALFYFHHDLPDGHTCRDGGCEIDLPYLIPDNFFTSLKPLLFQRRNARGDVIGEEKESIDKLNQLFYPYRLSYRYEPGARRLSTVDTIHNPDWVDHEAEPIKVEMELPAIGLETHGFLVPQQVPIKSVGTDASGRQIVKMCMGCFNVHDLDKRTACCPGHALEMVNFYAIPAVDAHFAPSKNLEETLQIARYMRAVTGDGRTQILGSDVEATRYQQIKGKYFPKKVGSEVDRFAFEARYQTPLQYEIEGRAVGWMVDQLCRGLAQNAELRHRLGDEDEQSLYEHALDTATSILHRALAGVSGVRLDSFQTAFNPDTGEVWVWEVYEGGAGLTEIFAHTMRRDALVVFEEMLRTVFCPIGLAEEALAKSQDDRGDAETHLFQVFERESQRFGLPRHNTTISGIYKDAKAELKRMQAMIAKHEARTESCRGKDGCPACIHGGVRRRRDERLPSRTIAALLLEQCIETLNHADLIASMTDFPLHASMPRLLGQNGEENRVLRF